MGIFYQTMGLIQKLLSIIYWSYCCLYVYIVTVWHRKLLLVIYISMLISLHFILLDVCSTRKNIWKKCTSLRICIYYFVFVIKYCNLLKKFWSRIFWMLLLPDSLNFVGVIGNSRNTLTGIEKPICRRASA